MGSKWTAQSVGCLQAGFAFFSSISGRLMGIMGSLPQCHKSAETVIFLLFSHVFHAENLIYDSKFIGHILRYTVYLILAMVVS